MKNELKAVTELISREHGLLLAWVFGSVAAGTAGVESDLDMAILSENPLEADEKAGLIERLSILTGRPVDLVDMRCAGPVVTREIFSQGKMILQRDQEQYARLLMRYWFDQSDWLPYRKQIIDKRREAWIEG